MFNCVIPSTMTVSAFLICLLGALILGVLTALVFSFRSEHSGNLPFALVLVPPIVTLVIMMVNGNIGAGRAVAGTFALVRFRSAPGSAKEITGIFFTVALGLACGMGYVGYAAVFFLILAAAAVGLERLRFGDRLQYNITVASDVDTKTMLPTMLLHTYSQNAVKHGIASKAGVGNVDVKVTRQVRDSVDGVLVSVRDDGVGRAEAARSGGYSTGQGLGILGQQIDLYNRTNKHKIVQKVTDLTDEGGRPAGTCFETWVPLDYQF